MTNGPGAKPLFWYRPRSDGGFEGPIPDSAIEPVRKASGAWVALHPGNPAPEADWLWGQFMDWCAARRVPPSQYNDLFAIVDRAREREMPVKRDPVDPVARGWLAALADAVHISAMDSHTRGKLREILTHLASQAPASTADLMPAEPRQVTAAADDPVPTTGAPRYDSARIVSELQATALGQGFFGNALRVAKDMPGVTSDDRALLDRYASGKARGTDHVALQGLALRILDDSHSCGPASTRIDVAAGKYTVVHEHGTGLRALRHGEPWRDLSGDGLVLALAQEIEALQEQVQQLQRAQKQQDSQDTPPAPRG